MPMSPELSQFLRLSDALWFGRCALDSLHGLLARAFVYFATAAAPLYGRNQPPANAPLIGRNGDWVGASSVGRGANGWSSKRLFERLVWPRTRATQLSLRAVLDDW
jgi:hypothetical protein